MLEVVFILVSTLLCGFGFWLRGSYKFEQWTGRGLTTAKLLTWALPTGVITAVGLMLFTGIQLQLVAAYAVATGAAYFAGASLGWWRSLSLGHGRNSPDKPMWAAYLRHFARGLWFPLPAAVVLYFAGISWPFIVLSGLFCVPAYHLGWVISPEEWDETDNLVPKNPNATEIGEIGFGLAMGLGLSLALAVPGFSFVLF